MKKKIQRVYVIGPLTPKNYHSSHPAIDYLANIAVYTKSCIALLLAGFDPFNASSDLLMFLLLDIQGGERITEPMIKRYSKSWMAVSDALLLTPGWKRSVGCQAEVKRAKELGIPIFDSIQAIVNHNLDIA